MENKNALANAMGVNANELTMDRENYSVTYKGQVYIVDENGGLEPFRLIELTSFNIKETAIEVQQGKTKQLTIENKTPSDANEQILWESSDETVATVDANGVVRGIAAGETTATITATSASGGVTSSTSCVVTVTEATSEIPEGVNSETYGGYVQNYGIDLGIGSTGAADDWRIFYDDGENIYLIAADYVRTDNEYLATAMSNMGATEYKSSYPYRVYWPSAGFKTSQGSTLSFETANGAADIFSNNRATGTEMLDGKGFLGFWKEKTTTNTNNNAKMTASLMDTKVWEGLAGGIPSGVAETLPNDNKTAYAIGGPTLSMFVESWNKTKTTKLYYNNATTTGYQVGTSSIPSICYVDLSSNPDYSGITSTGNTFTGDLYFPHKSDISNCYGYWLASPSASDTGIEIIVSYIGRVGTYSYDSNYYGVRPVVCLPSSVKVVETTPGSGIYNIVKK